MYHWCFYKHWQENAQYFSHIVIYKWPIITFLISNDLYSRIWYHNKEKQVLALSWPETQWASLYLPETYISIHNDIYIYNSMYSYEFEDRDITGLCSFIVYVKNMLNNIGYI